MAFTIRAILDEVSTYTEISKEDLEKARESEITTVNNKEFKDLVSAWSDGAYDEDPESMAWEVINLMK